MDHLPKLFLERLKKILPEEHYDSVLRSFSSKGVLSVRINTLKTSRESVLDALKEKNIRFKIAPWHPNILFIAEESRDGLAGSEFIKQGCLYVQGTSSMLPVLILDPRPGDKILDMCAAPGSKTTQIASLMNNEGQIICVENIKNRFYRLKSVISLLGVRNVVLKLMDGRKFKYGGRLFDKILVDAPCSSEGRFRTFNKKSVGYWSLRKIKEMVRKQRGLLLNASRLLKPEGILVYSTCTFSPEENEGVIDWLIKKTDGRMQVMPISLPPVRKYPAIKKWEDKEYAKQVEDCFRVLPSEQMDGFFIAKLIKNT